MAILDTDFLSSFFKIGRLKLVLKTLNVKHVVVSSTVYEELKEAKGLKVASIPAFLLFCKRKNVVSLDELKQIVNDLKAKDYYEFSEESRELLLK